MKIVQSYFAQKVNGPGFTLGWTLLGTHKVEKETYTSPTNSKYLPPEKEKKEQWPTLNHN